MSIIKNQRCAFSCRGKADLIKSNRQEHEEVGMGTNNADGMNDLQKMADGLLTNRATDTDSQGVPESGQTNRVTNVGEGFVSFWKNYANFRGRASRMEYWGAMLFLFIIGWGLNFIKLSMGKSLSEMTFEHWVWSLATFIPTLAICWRRLHDIGKSGANYWWILTGIGIIPYLIWACRDSQPGMNKYGYPPKGLLFNTNRATNTPPVQETYGHDGMPTNTNRATDTTERTETPNMSNSILATSTATDNADGLRIFRNLITIVAVGGGILGGIYLGQEYADSVYGEKYYSALNNYKYNDPLSKRLPPGTVSVNYIANVDPVKREYDNAKATSFLFGGILGGLVGRGLARFIINSGKRRNKGK